MQQLTRKSLGAMLASVGLATLIGVMGGTIVSADDVAPQDPLDGDAALTEAAVEMKQRCEWYVSGVPSYITLYPSGASEDEVYDGNRYTLAVELTDIAAWTDGNLVESSVSEDHEPCTFFGQETGIEVTGTWSGNGFTATADDDGDVLTPNVADPIMDFTADDINDPLSFGIAKDICRTPGNDGSGDDQWTAGTSITAGASVDDVIMALNVANATAIPQDVELANDKCNVTVAVNASIPAGKTPLYAGKRYFFNGPTFTTEIEIDSDR
jgi:hypothetical protein